MSLDNTIPASSLGQHSPLFKWEDSLSKLIGDVFDGNSFSCELAALEANMAASSQKFKEAELSRKVEIHNHVFQLGIDQAEEMKSAALARFVSSIVAGALGIVMSSSGAVWLQRLGKSLEMPDKAKTGVIGDLPKSPTQLRETSVASNAKSTTTSNGGVVDAKGASSSQEPTNRGGAERSLQEQASSKPKDPKEVYDDVMVSQNDVYKAQTKTQFVNMVFTQLVTQITDIVKSSGEYVASNHDVSAQIAKTTYDALMAHAEEVSELFGIEKDIFENSLRAVLDTKQYSAFNS